MKTSIDYMLPFNKELAELNLLPYKTNKTLESKINYLFSHTSFKHNKLYIDVSTSGSRCLTRDMAKAAVACMRHFMLYPQQYANNVENIEWQILIRMWKQTFKHCKMQEIKLDKYYGTKEKLLSIDNGWVEELMRTVKDKDYVQHYDDMVKKRVKKSYLTGEQVGLRDRVSYGTHEGGARFEYYADSV